MLVKLFYDAISLVKGVTLTPREIDTIACLLSGKGTKSIAALLSVSPRTIETHIRNIMLKYECSSRDQIITVVEKAGQFDQFKDIYRHLLRYSSFQQTLQRIANLRKHQAHPTFVVYAVKPHAEYELLEQIVTCLKMAGVHISINTQTPWPITLSDALAVAGLIERKGDDNKETVYLVLLNSETDTICEINTININLGDKPQQQLRENLYLVVFAILKHVISPSIPLNKLIADFMNTAQALEQQHAKQQQSLKSVQDYKSGKLRFFFSRKKVITMGSLVCLLLMGATTVFYKHKNLTHIVHSALALPHKQNLLNRSDLLIKIENAFKNQNSNIKNLMLVGTGGSGKTTLARLYARSSQNYSLVWEINAETKESILLSFKSLAYALSKTSTHKSDLDAIRKNTDVIEQEKQLLLFIKNRLREESPWLLIYDNIETLSEIKDFIPDDWKAWGAGEILFTTRDINSKNTNYIDPETVIILDTLTHKEAQTLLTQILYESSKKSLSSAQQEEIQQFLQHIPNYPLDIALAGHYVKNTKISLAQYVKRIQSFTEEWDQAQAAFLKDTDYYIKTRYHIVRTSLEKVINANPEFYSLLVLLCLLNHQEIPKDLINLYKKPLIVDLFLRQLKKQALITTESNSFSIPTGTFSLHANIQDLGKYFLMNVLQNKITNSILVTIIDTLSQYAAKAREQNNTYLMALLAKHYETLLAQHKIFSPAQIGRVQGELGTFYISLGNIVKAQESLERSVKLLKQHDEKNYVSIIQALTYLGYAYQDLGDYQKAKDILIIAHQLCLQHLAPQQKTYAFTLVNLGKVHSKLGDYAKAIKYFEEGIIFYRNDQDHQNAAWTSIYLANIHRRLGKYQKAKNLLEEGLILYQKYFPEHYANIALTSVHLGQVYRELEDDQKAEILTKQGLRIYQQYFSTNYSKIAWTLAQLGNIYRRLKKYDLAITTLEQSLQLYQDHLPENKIKRYETLVSLAKVYRDCGELKKAEVILETSLRVFQVHYGPDHVETGKIYLELGRVFYLQEALTLAEISLQNARAILQKAEHPRQYLCLEYLGDLALRYVAENQYYSQKKQEFQNQAYQCFQQSLVCLEQCELKQSPSFVRLLQKQILSQNFKSRESIQPI